MKKFRYLLFSILLVILSTCMVMAEVPSTKNRDVSNNFGVNKRWKVTEKNKKNILDTPYVNAKECIYDFSKVLTNSEIKLLKEEIDAFRNKYHTEIVILTYSLNYTDDEENENFAADFYDYNDFGIDYKNYDGILLFRNTYSYDPYYDMYTFGEAQFYFPYDSGRYDIILDGIYDDLHEGRYYNGFHKFIEYLDNYYSQGMPDEAKDYELDDNGDVIKKGSKDENKKDKKDSDSKEENNQLESDTVKIVIIISIAVALVILIIGVVVLLIVRSSSGGGVQ